ncbi:MAG: histidine ammonia-lyase [Bacteroidota bacterium]|nr:histidine ammonia-lyase [Bacteroidota bacterium]MDP4232612.1 histidine ammonia-lyase [Bacteroidota bacterium]MDP4242934.1 histidine ammonia-lyase [Bacteroidota bacterium]MDP4286491.1 histidine ammonia-lyase [Bacteroidota bacterium]
MLILDGNSLTIEDVALVAHGQERDIRIAPEARTRIEHSRKLVEDWVANGETIYGITTGFGEFANISIPQDQIRQLQQNLLRSHSAGVGEPLPAEVVRAMLLLRANALAKGCSGVRSLVIEQLLKMLAADALPVIPSRGSVGSSGDLAPLAHLALAMTGEGYISMPIHGQDGRATQPAAEALRLMGIEPLRLEAKEGLALINGTQMMTAIGCLSLHRAQQLAELADISASMSFEALRATDRPFDARIHAARPHAGQMLVAGRMRRLIAGSEIRESHREHDPRVQDAYSIRCIPQVHGAVRDTIEFVRHTLEIEINSATDNPLIIPDEENGAHLEGGNFHGEPIAFALDYLAIATSELASISERRIERLVNGALSGGLPRFLAKNGGLNSGYMIAQYTAAALVSENKVLAHPASVDSIPTSGNQEDHNSMGSVAALKLRTVIENVERVLAIELLISAQGIDFLKPLRPGKGSGEAYDLVRSRVPMLEHDRNVSDDIAAVLALLKEPALFEIQ